jgi:PAS domain S-box-containing protein
MENTFPPTPPPIILPPSDKRNLPQTLLATAFLLALSLSIIFLFSPEAIRSLTAKATDIILRTVKPPPSEIEIVLVDIDESSLKKHGQWPWPRNLLARLLTTIQDAGAQSIGIGMIFPEQDRSSPINWQSSLATDFGHLVDTSNIPAEDLDHDAFLARSLAAGPFVLGYEFLFGSNLEPSAADCPITPVTVSRASRFDRPAPDINFHRADDVLCNYQPLANAAPFNGFLNGAPDSDGVLRRLPLLMHYGGKIYPSFALAVLMRFQDAQTLVLETDKAQLNLLSFAGNHVFLDNQGNFLLGPPSPSRPPRLSATDILLGKMEADQLRHKIVLIGSTAQGLAQGFPTPYSAAETLLDLHTAAIRALVAEVPTVRPPIFPYCEGALSILLSLVLAIVIARWPMVWSIGFCLLTTAAIWGGAQALLQARGLLFSPLLPSVAVILNFCLLTTLKFRHCQLQAKSETSDALLLLKTSESSLRSILHAVPDIIFRLDDSGNIVFISPAICKYTKSPEIFLGSSIFSYVAPADHDKARFRLNERRTGERATFDLEIRLLLTGENQSDGESYRFFSVSVEGLYRGGLAKSQCFIGSQGIMKDITDRKKLELQLLQAQKMEVVGNLAAGIAHDLNNILSGLVSYPDLLLLEIPKDNPLHDKISIIQRSGQKAATIVQDLLSLARRNIAILTVSNINQIITDYLTSIECQRLQARHPNIAIHTELAKNLMNIKGSAVHLSKMLMNLLHNGMEAMPAGGGIFVRTCNTCLDTAIDGYERIPAGEYVCLEVADNGIGIPATSIPQIFEPFFTRKATTTSGTGLGMTIVWATVKDHHGYLDIHSREGQGTTLTIYLPATAESVDTERHQVVLEDYLGSETILVVDDTAEQLDITANILKKLGYIVHTAGSGEEAVRMIAKRPMDLVILDMIMPGGIDGLETYKQIRAISPNQKAIITSGYSESERVRAMQDLGAGTFVQKPFTMERIGMAVKTALAASAEDEDALEVGDHGTLLRQQ